MAASVGMTRPAGTKRTGRSEAVAGDGEPPVPTNTAEAADRAEHDARLAVEGRGIPGRDTPP